jgi:hypothetical protein
MSGDRDPDDDYPAEGLAEALFANIEHIWRLKMADYLSRNDILEASDIVVEDVAVPEWHGTVRVRGLTGTERDAFEEASMHRYGKKAQNRELNLKDFRARLVSWSIVDEDGKRVFADADVQALGKKSAAALQRVFDAAARLSGLSDTDIEELIKNSQEDQSEDSGSD